MYVFFILPSFPTQAHPFSLFLSLSLFRNKAERKKEKKGKVGEVKEEAFAIRTFRNGLGVFVSK